jgi:hypothetical protein
MSKHVNLLAGALLIAGVMAAPVGARAQHHHGGGGGTHHGGGHYGGSYHGGHGGGYGYRGGYHGYRGGWGGGGVYLGFGVPGFYYGDPYYYADPYYYDEPPPPAPECEWEQIRVWRNGHWVWRDVQRCY